MATSPAGRYHHIRTEVQLLGNLCLQLTKHLHGICRVACACFKVQAYPDQCLNAISQQFDLTLQMSMMWINCTCVAGLIIDTKSGWLQLRHQQPMGYVISSVVVSLD